MSINIELLKILFIYFITITLDRFFKKCNLVISYNILNLSFIQNKLKNEKRLS